MFIYLDWCYGAIRWWGFTNRVVWFWMCSVMAEWTDLCLVWKPILVLMIHDEHWIHTGQHSSHSPYQYRMIVILSSPGHMRQRVEIWKTQFEDLCLIVSLNQRFLPMLGGVVLWMFKEPLVLVLWTSQNERITGFTSLKRKTESKNHWFSLSQKPQRTDDFLEGTDREPVILWLFMKFWEPQSYTKTNYFERNWELEGKWVYTLMGILSSIPRAS